MDIRAYIRKDWPFIPLIILLFGGYISPFIELIPIEKQQFQLFWRVLGIMLLIGGTTMELMVRYVLVRKAKFPGFQSTKILQIVEGHTLIISGIFKYIRHPLYTGRILASFGWVLLFSSVTGIFLISVMTIFIFPRIKIEEEMLMNKFGDLYMDYQKNTKKLIPFIY